MLRAMDKIISIMQYVLIFIGIAILVLFVIPKVVGINPFVVLSGSMEDEIKTGSIAYVDTRVKVGDIKEGDIIAFNVDDVQVTHRVIAINEDNTFTTKGDANSTEDLAPVKFENYKGKTIFSIPYLGKLVSKYKTKTGYFVTFTIIGLGIVSILFSGGEKGENNAYEKMCGCNKKEEKLGK